MFSLKAPQEQVKLMPSELSQARKALKFSSSLPKAVSNRSLEFGRIHDSQSHQTYTGTSLGGASLILLLSPPQQNVLINRLKSHFTKCLTRTGASTTNLSDFCTHW